LRGGAVRRDRGRPGGHRLPGVHRGVRLAGAEHAGGGGGHRARGAARPPAPPLPRPGGRRRAAAAMNEWLWAATVLTVLVLGLTLFAALRPAGDALVALELAGLLVTMILLLLAEGTHRQGFVDLALVLAV